MRKFSYSLFFGFFIILLLLYIWFAQGLTIGATESGLPFYNVNQLIYTYEYTWSPVEIGFAPGFTLSSIPLYVFQSFLSHLGFQDYFVQAVEFSFLLLFPFLGIYLCRTFIQKEAKKFILFSSLFYIFNTIALISVWNRLQYPFMFVYALLPFAVFLLWKAIQEKKYVYALVINFVNLVCLMAFSSIPTIEIYWFTVLLFALFLLIINYKKKKEIFFICCFVCITLLLWVVFNIWWLLPSGIVLLTDPYTASQTHVTGDDISTLISLSSTLGNLSYVFRLMNRESFVQMKDVWGPIYFIPLFTIFSYFVPFLAFLPLLLKKRPQFLYPFLGMALIVIFLMKGSNGPFGGVFLFLFSNIRLLEAVRNPFEKFSLMLPLAYSFLIGYSFFVVYEFVYKKINKITAKISVLLLGVVLFGFLVFPMWNRWVFTNVFIPTNNTNIGYYVKVPSYYAAANTWLTGQSDDFRVVALPIGGEGITQNWEYGYNGLEVSNELFNKPYISYATSIQFLQPLINQIEYTLFNQPEYFSQMLSLLDAKYIMVRSDINNRDRNMTSPNVFTKYLKSPSGILISHLTFAKTFGKLTFYKNTKPIPQIYIAKNIYYSPVDVNFADVFSLTDFHLYDAIDNDSGNGIDANVNKSLKTGLIEPYATLDYNSYSPISLSQAEQSLPYVRFLPGSIFYPFDNLKDTLSLQMEKDDGLKFFDYVLLTDKKITELQKYLLGNYTDHTSQVMKNYADSIDNLEAFIKSDNASSLDTNLQYFASRVSAQQVILNNLQQTAKDPIIKKQLDLLQQKLDALAVFANIAPLYKPIVNSAFSTPREIYRFTVPSTTTYDVLLSNEYLTDEYYSQNNPENEVQINDAVHTASYKNVNPYWITFGTYRLKKGINEIQIAEPTMLNLLNYGATNSGSFNLGKKTQTKSFSFKHFNPYSSYIISFDVKWTAGTCLRLAMTSDVDALVKGKDLPEWKDQLGCSTKKTSWQSVSEEFTPFNGSTDAVLHMIASTKKVKRGMIEYKDLKVTRDFSNTVLLRSQNNSPVTLGDPKISFTKINPTRFIVHIKNAKKPFILVFSEAYHNLWEATYQDTQKQIPSKDHFLVNSYANGWYITRTGDYTVTIDFSAEKYLSLGKVISGIGVCVSLAVFLGYHFYKRRRYVVKN